MAHAEASIKGIQHKGVDGSAFRVGIIRARWNREVIDALVQGVKQALKEANVLDENIVEIEVPGSFELPFATQQLLQSSHISVDAVIPIGCLIKGETMHFEYICDSVSHAIMRLGLECKKPVIFGVLACLTEQQALARAGLVAGSHNHGYDWGKAAVEMASLQRTLQ
eukprot:GILJ01005096.1.p2 GENE.GILJ01005096.1~~GILJ01005096.1.p2  ORF type:complete len:181 (-),score=22.58 GILJ01005096.1:972-1472(-)